MEILSFHPNLLVCVIRNWKHSAVHVWTYASKYKYAGIHGRPMRADYEVQFERANSALFAMMKANRLWQENANPQTANRLENAKEIFAIEGRKADEIKNEIKATYNAYPRA